jgi:hypothetical protein
MTPLEQQQQDTYAKIGKAFVDSFSHDELQLISKAIERIGDEDLLIKFNHYRLRVSCGKLKMKLE